MLATSASMTKSTPFISLLLILSCVMAAGNIAAQTNIAKAEARPLPLEQLKAKAESGDAKAQFALGALYHKGDGVGKDRAEALKWYRKAAEQGYAAAQCELGDLCDDGVEALKWYRKAAEQGYATGQAVLAINYEHGRGGAAKDYFEAVKWYRKAAEQGNAQGEVGLATMYKNGHGVAQDYAEAGRWFRKAANQGSAVGQANLGGMYIMGQGVEKDFVEAYVWLDLAVMSGFGEVGDLHDRVAKHLSEEQLSKAQKRINQLKAEIAARPAGNETKP